MCVYNRFNLTAQSMRYLFDRTKYPYRLFIIDNGSDQRWEEMFDFSFEFIRLRKNYGIHTAWNIAKEMAESEYFITTDNDIYVPDLEPDWLSQLVGLLGRQPKYAAIALQPHTYLGASAPTNAVDGVCDVAHCGAVMRIMRTDVVRKVGGWEHRLDANRNHEEKTICNKLRDAGYKVGYAEKMKCYHDFGDDDNWGYGDIHPHKHGHRIPGGGRFATDPEKKGEIWPPPSHFTRNKDLYNTKTWELKS